MSENSGLIKEFAYEKYLFERVVGTEFVSSSILFLQILFLNLGASFSDDYSDGSLRVDDFAILAQIVIICLIISVFLVDFLG